MVNFPPLRFVRINDYGLDLVGRLEKYSKEYLEEGQLPIEEDVSHLPPVDSITLVAVDPDTDRPAITEHVPVSHAGVDYKNLFPGSKRSFGTEFTPGVKMKSIMLSRNREFDKISAEVHLTK